MNKTCKVIGEIVTLRRTRMPFVVMLREGKVPFFVGNDHIRSMADDGLFMLMRAYVAHMQAGGMAYCHVFHPVQEDDQMLSYVQTADKLLDLIQAKASNVKVDVANQGWEHTFRGVDARFTPLSGVGWRQLEWNRHEFTAESGKKVELMAHSGTMFWKVNECQLVRGELPSDFIKEALHSIYTLDESDITDDHVFIYKMLLEDAQAKRFTDGPYECMRFGQPPAGFGFMVPQPYMLGKDQKLRREDVERIRAYHECGGSYRLEPRWGVPGEPMKPWTGSFGGSQSVKDFFNDLMNPESPEKKDE